MKIQPRVFKSQCTKDTTEENHKIWDHIGHGYGVWTLAEIFKLLFGLINGLIILLIVHLCSRLSLNITLGIKRNLVSSPKFRELLFVVVKQVLIKPRVLFHHIKNSIFLINLRHIEWKLALGFISIILIRGMIKWTLVFIFQRLEGKPHNIVICLIVVFQEIQLMLGLWSLQINTGVKLIKVVVLENLIDAVVTIFQSWLKSCVGAWTRKLQLQLR